MGIQVISRDGQPEYAVVPWAEYQALLAGAGQAEDSVPAAAASAPAMSTSALPSSPTDTATCAPTFAQLGEVRTAKGLEAAVLARAVGISPTYLAMIESGEREPDAAIKRSLAWELGVPSWRDAS